MMAAIQVVDDGMHIWRASLVNSNPHTTLTDWLTRKTKTRKRGREGTFTIEVERLIVEWICKHQDLGWPLANLDLRLKVAEITQIHPTPFRQGIPGSEWLKWWKHWHLELTLRVPQALVEINARHNRLKNDYMFYMTKVQFYNIK
jgi:hypothetical protein